MNRSSIYYLVLLLGLPFYSGCSNNTPSLETQNTQSIASNQGISPDVAVEVEQNGCVKSFTKSEDSCGKGSFYSQYGKETHVNHSTKPLTASLVHQLPMVQGSVLEIHENDQKLYFPQYKDQIVILETFGKECVFCTKQGRILNMLKNSSKGKVQLIGLQVEGRMTPKETKKIFKKHGIRHPVVEGEDAEKLQDYLQFKKEWDGILPFILVIKPDGEVVNVHHGVTSLKDLRKDVNNASGIIEKPYKKPYKK